MSSEEFRHPFQIPPWGVNSGHKCHEAMRRFVNEQVPTIVVKLLIEHPEFVSPVGSVVESEFLGHQGELSKESHITNEISRHLKILRFTILRQ